MTERIGIQGSRGAFHEIAARQLYGARAYISYLDTFDDLFVALKDGSIDIAVAAIANINVGFIDEPHEELVVRGNAYWIAGETYVTVAHQLLGLPGTKLKDITSVHSMAPALQQCAHTLHRLLPKANLIEEADTAVSAELVQALGDKTHAAVASKAAGELNGLVVIEPNIQDRTNNVTRFLALRLRKSDQKCSFQKASKTTLLLETPDKHGALFKALFPFWLTRINISTLHSSFVEDSDFYEKFFLEFDAHAYSTRARIALRFLYWQGCKVMVLGSYGQAQIPPR